MHEVIAGLPQLLRGLAVTAEISGIVLVAASIAGSLVGVILLYGRPAARMPARLYVDVTRGIPLLVLIFASYFGLPALGLRLSALAAGITALSVFSAAHVAEIVRGGVDSIPAAQSDAARAIGLTFAQRLRLVILPQAARRMLPPWVNETVGIVRGTALLSLLGVGELLLAMQDAVGSTLVVIPFYTAAALLYFSLNFSLSQIAALLERRLAHFRY